MSFLIIPLAAAILRSRLRLRQRGFRAGMSAMSSDTMEGCRGKPFPLFGNRGDRATSVFCRCMYLESSIDTSPRPSAKSDISLHEIQLDGPLATCPNYQVTDDVEFRCTGLRQRRHRPHFRVKRPTTGTSRIFTRWQSQ